MDQTVHVLNGPNLNLLGEREPGLYGVKTLGELEALCRETAERHGLSLVFRQTNREGEMIDWIQQARQSAGIVINPAGFTCHGVAVRDALEFCTCPVIEVHITNIYGRADEPWRADSVTSEAAMGVIAGVGVDGYSLALNYLGRRLSQTDSSGTFPPMAPNRT